MDGSNPFDIMTMDNRGKTQRGAQVVSSLAIDLIDKKLYWSSNDNMNHISSCDYGGENKDINNDHHDRHVETLSILNRNMFVQNLEYSADTEVSESDILLPNYFQSSFHQSFSANQNLGV